MSGGTQPDRRCRALLVELSRYLDGELSAGRCRAIEAHLAGCPACAEAAAALGETMTACRRAPAIALPAGVRRRARARIKALLDR